ncbi:hypothetical protein WN51_00961 [Melipona quadrifasciata]|uniref:Uncharacterized protein n=1 Tax=Melipona quadrifasciata TaxID=166423 RepID=A0A0M8ZVQ2_9HYME|nr:hypothetical protein WN51_00961 [Melipona quadrifasciata]
MFLRRTGRIESRSGHRSDATTTTTTKRHTGTQPRAICVGDLRLRHIRPLPH